MQWDGLDGDPHPGLDYLVVGGLRTDVENSKRVEVPPLPGHVEPVWEGAIPETYQQLYPNPNVLWTIRQVEDENEDPQTGQPNWIRVFKPLMNPNGGKICVSHRLVLFLSTFRM